MRNAVTDNLGERLTAYFQSSGLTEDEFIDMLNASDFSIFDFRHTHQGATGRYAYFHFMYEGEVVSAYTLPDSGPDWYCKY